MDKRTLTVFIAAVMLAGCKGGGWWPWSSSSSSGEGAPRTPPGATGYACEGGKRLLVRFEADAKSAWVIFPDREFRLNRTASGSGEQFSNGRTTLEVKGDEASLQETGGVQFAKCKLEP